MPDLDHRCLHHSKRPAAAVCRGCGKMLCTECATKLDGINYCSTCAAARGVETPEPPPSTSRRGVRGLVLAFFFVLLMSVGIAYGIGRPLLTGFGQASDNEEILEDIRRGLHTFHLDHNRWPTQEEGLAALLDEPAAGDEQWAGPYLYIELLDAYGAEVLYWSSPGAEEAYIVSLGPNGELDSTDVGSSHPEQAGDDLLVWTDDASPL